jgi:hypothetical protein
MGSIDQSPEMMAAGGTNTGSRTLIVHESVVYRVGFLA